MKKYFFIGILFVLLLTGCNKHEESINELLENQSDLENKINLLIDKNASYDNEIENNHSIIKDLEMKLENKNNEILTLNDEIKKLEEVKEEYRMKYDDIVEKERNNNGYEIVQKIIEYKQTHKDIELVKSYANIYNPKEVNIGDNIGGFVISDLKVKGDFENVIFDGYFVISGVLSMDEHNGFLCITISNENIANNLPISLKAYDLGLNHKKHGYFWIGNPEIVEKALGSDKYNELELGYASFDVVGLFKDYEYFYNPDTEWANSMKVVEFFHIEEHNN